METGNRHVELRLLRRLFIRPINKSSEWVPAVLPLIFRELRDHGGHWYWALGAITRHEPEVQEAGNIRLMKQAWLSYAREHNLL